MSAWIYHTELSCALGSSTASCFDAWLRAQRNTTTVSISQADEELRLPYFSLDAQAIVGDLVCRRMQELDNQISRCLKAIPLSAREKKRTGLFLASSSLGIDISEQEYKSALLENPQTAVPIPYVNYNGIGDALRNKFELGPHTYTSITACTSAANALLFAERMLQLEKIDHAIVMGYEFFNETSLLGFSGLELLSPTGELNPFDSRRNGLVLGEACSLIFVSRERKNNSLKLLGGASNTDSFSPTAANTDGSSIEAVINQALAFSKLGSGDIVAIKSHGTASILNDEAEAAGILRVFNTPPPVIALKPYIGHTLGAAAGVETVLCLEALSRGVLPGNPGIGADPKELGIALNQESINIASGPMLLNYFAFGGNNSVLLIGGPECK